MSMSHGNLQQICVCNMKELAEMANEVDNDDEVIGVGQNT